MSRMLLAALALAAVLLAAAGICSGQDFAEIRGPVSLVKNGETYTLGPKETDNKFYGFYYDIDDDLGTESITMSISNGDTLDGDATPAGVQYMTEVQKNRFEFENWGAYDCIGFLGENHFAGYIREAEATQSHLASLSENKDLISSEMLSLVLIDSDDEMTLSTDTPLKLKDGYELRIGEIDINGDKVNVDLYKNGALVTKSVATTGTNSIGDSSFCYKKDSGDTAGLVSIAVHFKNVFRGSDRNAATVDGIFQISENTVRISSGTQYDKMRISSVTNSKIEMDNKDNTIRLTENRDIPLMRGLRIKTADQDDISDSNPLRFYLYKRLTDPGVYQINGRVDAIVDGREVHWDSKSFSGFYYDLDRDAGDEELMMTISGGLDNGFINPDNIVYQTQAQSIPFNHEEWGSYYVIGLLGERYLAGYSTYGSGRTSFLQDSSDESNLMQYDLLSRILIDSDDTANLTPGSVFPLEEGYELRIKEIDQHSNKVVIALAMNGKEVLSDYVIELSENPTFRYRKMLGEMQEVPLIAVNFREFMAGTEISVAEIEGIWQISEKTTKIGEGTKLGEMTISSVDSKEGQMSIDATNEDDTISLGKDRTIDLMDDYYIKTADQETVSDSDPLRFFIFKEVKVPGGFADSGESDIAETVAEQPDASQEKETNVETGNETIAEPGIPPEQTDGPKKQPGLSAILALAATVIVWCALRRDE